MISKLYHQKELSFENMNIESAKRTRSILMFLGPLLHQYSNFEIPFSGGCNLGTRTVEPHLSGLKHFGANIIAKTDFYEISNNPQKSFEANSSNRTRRYHDRKHRYGSSAFRPKNHDPKRQPKLYGARFMLLS